MPEITTNETTVNLTESNPKTFDSIEYTNTPFSEIITDISAKIESKLGGQPTPIPGKRIIFIVEDI